MDSSARLTPNPSGDQKPESGNNPIHKDMLMSDILMQYPQTGEVMMEYGLHCIGCHFSAFDSIEQGCRIHGFDDEQINQLIRDLNAVI